MKSNKVLISVIVPIYKVEKYLDRCIKSIINQTYKNLEIILVDDGSPDNCPKMCDNWAKRDKRIKVIHKENGGVSSARNVGLDNSTGEYIGFVDSDDYIDNTMYEKMLKLLKKENADMCFCDITVLELNGEINNCHFNTKPIQNKKEFLENIYKINCLNFAIWNKLIRKDLIDKIKFSEDIYIKEDVLFLFECINNLNKVSYIKENLYFYDMRETSALHKVNYQKEITSLNAISKMIEILKSNQINNYLEEQCNYICRFYKYKSRLGEEKIKVDLSKYEQQVKEYLNDNLLNKNIGLKNRIKVLMATRFNKLYCLLIKIKDRMR